MVAFADQVGGVAGRVSRRQWAMPLAGFSGVLAFLTFNVGWLLGDLAQGERFSPSRDDISYLGAMTAHDPWLYNQLAANLTGTLLVALAVGLWLALASSRLGRTGAALVAATGVGMFLDGLFRLDCQSINSGCSNQSWHAHAHKIESGFTVAFTFASILLLALAFRRTAQWLSASVATIAGIPAVLVANVAFSPLGPGAATRAGTVVVLATFAFLGVRLLTRTGLEPIDAEQASSAELSACASVRE